MRWAIGTVLTGSSLGLLASLLLRPWVGQLAEPLAVALLASTLFAGSRLGAPRVLATRLSHPL